MINIGGDPYQAPCTLIRVNKEYEKLISLECKTNSKVLFKYSNFKNKTKSNIIKLKDGNGKLINDKQTNANILNQFFTSVFTTEDDAPELILHSSHKTLFDEELPDPFDFKIPTPQNIINDLEIHESDVKDLLIAVDPYKSTSPECIHPRILHECANNLSAPITEIFKESIQTGNLPSYYFWYIFITKFT